MKKIFLAFACLFLVGLTCFFIQSCQSDNEPAVKECKEYHDFMGQFVSNMRQVISYKKSPISRSEGDNGQGGDSTIVYINNPGGGSNGNTGGGGDGGSTGGGNGDVGNFDNGDDDDEVITAIATAETIGDLAILVANFGVEIGVDSTMTHTDSIVISNTDAIEALQPLTAQSRQYFTEIGLTNDDIDDILDECGVDETILIPAALAIIEHNMLVEQYAGFCTSKNKILKGFVVSAYAIEWNTLKSCFFEAFGLDIALAAGNIISGGMTKAALKQAIKHLISSVATKFAGPVAVAITGVYIWGCYNGWWDMMPDGNDDPYIVPGSQSGEEGGEGGGLSGEDIP